ncbi:DUF1453 domain-containing protein [Kitasatospora sp. NPDC053057]|uniref:DUF1453 domain-containing protein n=1 Tax=Kitasatospora sp. NPDC053057 TaxID=3364062 RepID=UPI0037CC44B0
MNNWVHVALIAAVVVVVVVRRLRGEPLNARDLFGPPVVLTGLGLWALSQQHGLGVGGYVWVGVGAALGTAFGALRGATIRVYERDGVLWQRYTGWTFLAAAISLALMAGFAMLAEHNGLASDARPVQLSIGVGFLGEALVVGYRALSSGIPFAPERRDSNSPFGGRDSGSLFRGLGRGSDWGPGRGSDRGPGWGSGWGSERDSGRGADGDSDRFDRR